MTSEYVTLLGQTESTLLAAYVGVSLIGDILVQNSKSPVPGCSRVVIQRQTVTQSPYFMKLEFLAAVKAQI